MTGPMAILMGMPLKAPKSFLVLLEEEVWLPMRGFAAAAADDTATSLFGDDHEMMARH